jgi:hypothetical protein
MDIVAPYDHLGVSPSPPSSDIPDVFNAVQDVLVNDRTGVGIFGVARCGGSLPTLSVLSGDTSQDAHS